jgi:hypothetical protein
VLERLVAEMIGDGDVWCAPLGDVAEHLRPVLQEIRP